MRIFRLFLFLFVFAAPLLAQFAVSGEAFARDSTASSFQNTAISSRYATVALGTIIEWPQNQAFPERDKWRECNGVDTIPGDSDLGKRLGGRTTTTPNLNKGNGYFLRANRTPNQEFADTLRSHKHSQPEHTHGWSGRLVDTTVKAALVNKKVKGTAAGQKYDETSIYMTLAMDRYNYPVPPSSVNPEHVHTAAEWFDLNMNKIPGDYTGRFGPSDDWNQRNFVQGVTHTRYTNKEGDAFTPYGSEITANVVNRSSVGEVDHEEVEGRVGMSGNDPTRFTAMKGDTRSSSATMDTNTENAPTSYSARYFIRIND